MGINFSKKFLKKLSLVFKLINESVLGKNILIILPVVLWLFKELIENLERLGVVDSELESDIKDIGWVRLEGVGVFKNFLEILEQEILLFDSEARERF